MKRTGKLLRPLLDSLYSLTSITKRLIKEDIREELAEAIWESLEGIRYLYKSDAYSYEQECRFIIYDIDESKIRFEYQEQNNSPDVRHYYEHEDLKVKKYIDYWQFNHARPSCTLSLQYELLHQKPAY